MRNFVLILCILISCIASCQTTSLINSSIGLADTLQKNEIRIYKKYSISNATDIFRMYKDKDRWKVELYNYYGAVNKDDKDKFDNGVIINTTNLEDVWGAILSTNVHYIHDQEEIRYKLQGKPRVVYENGQKLYEVSRTSVTDGVGYDFEIRSNNKFNVVHYSNPEAYLRLYPEVDELQTFVSMLDIIKSSFTIWND